MGSTPNYNTGNDNSQGGYNMGPTPNYGNEYGNTGPATPAPNYETQGAMNALQQQATAPN